MKNRILLVLLVCFGLVSVLSANTPLPTVKGRLLAEMTGEFYPGLFSDSYSIKPLFKLPSDPERQLSFQKNGLHRWYVVSWDPSTADNQTVMQYFLQQKGVGQVQEDNLLEICIIPSDTLYTDQYALSLMQCDEAWEVQGSAEDVIIGIIDTGCKIDHEDLADNIYRNPNEELNGEDDDENGYVDDVNGWDFVSVTEQIIEMSGMTPIDEEDYAPADNEVFPDYIGHGTFVSGIAGACSDNVTGIASPAWNVSLMELRVAFSVIWMAQETGAALESDYAAAIQYAVDNGVDIINFSSGTSQYLPAVHTAIQYAAENDVVMVAGSGNAANTMDFYPAAYSEVIAVAATDANDQVAYFSTYGTWIDLCAPGLSILGTTPDEGHYNSLYSYEQGTSLSAPYVASVAALLRSSEPELTSEEIRERLQDACVSIDDLNPVHAGLIGYGRLNAWYALDPDATGIEDENYVSQPDVFEIVDCYPNPFNSSLHLRFSTPDNKEVQIAVYNVLGQAIYEHVELYSVGTHTVLLDAAHLTSGGYVVRLSYPGETHSRKVFLLR